MPFRKLIIILVWVVCLMGLLVTGDAGVGNGTPKRCNFPAIYNFGDSNSDTGERSASLTYVHPPNGETFFGEPSGRECDGRLIIDFIAEELGLPYLDAYLDSIGTNFRHGANFATGGACILEVCTTPFHLKHQIRHFSQFKNRTSVLYEKLSRRNDEVALFTKNSIPVPQEFTDALYTIDIGQNDIGYGLENSSPAETNASIPTLLNTFSEAIYTLYELGARNFWIHNTGPLGCLPINLINNSQPINPVKLDNNGCLISHNELVQEFNKQLKQRVVFFKEKLGGAAFTYVDVYSAKYSLISGAKTLGFEDPFGFCCGGYYNNNNSLIRILCGKPALVNGTLLGGNPCLNPSKHISWDSIHYTEAANLFVAKTIVNGSLSEPKDVSIGEACHFF